jgi:hypothetical protein
MPYKTKQINFGEVDHFLYVRINCICADLDYNFKDFVEQSYCILTELIDEKGVTHFKVLIEQYEKYREYREKTRYAPRMIDKKHAFVVDGIHEEIHEHLLVIKDENRFPWSVLLAILLMALEYEIDKKDRTDWKEGEIHTFVVDEFMERQTAHKARNPVPRKARIDYPYQVDKTDKRREFEAKIEKYPERADEDDED